MDPQALRKLGGAGVVALAGVAGAVGLFNTSLYNGKVCPMIYLTSVVPTMSAVRNDPGLDKVKGLGLVRVWPACSGGWTQGDYIQPIKRD